MSNKNIKKNEIMNKFKIHEKDCGSTEVQIALLSDDINILISHFKKHKKDLHSKIGLLKKVNKRKNLLKYLKLKNIDKYLNLIKELGIRK